MTSPSISEDAKDRTIRQLKLHIEELDLLHQFDHHTIEKLREENEQLRERVRSLITDDDDKRIQLLVKDALRRKLGHLKCLFEVFTKAQEHSMQPFKEFVEDIDKEIEKCVETGAIGPPPKVYTAVGLDNKYAELRSKFVPELERICESPLKTPQREKTPQQQKDTTTRKKRTLQKALSEDSTTSKIKRKLHITPSPAMQPTKRQKNPSSAKQIAKGKPEIIENSIIQETVMEDGPWKAGVWRTRQPVNFFGNQKEKDASAYDFE